MSNLRRTALALLGLGATGILMGGCPAMRPLGSGGDPPPIIVADGSVKLTAQGNGTFSDDTNNHEYIEPNLSGGSNSMTVSIDKDGNCTNGAGISVTSFDAKKVTLIGGDGTTTDNYDVMIVKSRGVVVKQGNYGHKATGQKQVDLGTDYSTWTLRSLNDPADQISCSFGPSPKITLTPK